MGRARDVLNKRIQSEEQRVESRVVKRERERYFVSLLSKTYVTITDSLLL